MTKNMKRKYHYRVIAASSLKNTKWLRKRYFEKKYDMIYIFSKAQFQKPGLTNHYKIERGVRIAQMSV